jgi:hypothetical protein
VAFFSERGRWLSQALLLLVPTAFTIGIIETIPRFVPQLAKFRPLPRIYVGDRANRPSDTMAADPVTGWRMRPHLILRRGGEAIEATYATNSSGFRSSEEFDPADPRQHIVLAGDSFTFGVGVEFDDTFGARLDTALENAVVYNLGMPGFGLDQIALSVKHQALPLNPSLIIVTFISESFPRSLDAYRLPEGWNKPAFKVVEGQLVRKGKADRPGPVAGFLERHSVFWRAGTLASRAAAQRWPHGESWELNTAILRDIDDTLSRAGIPVLFVFMPTYYWPSFPAAAKFISDQLRADFIDLGKAPGFNQSAMYYPGDGHMNASGHAWVAQTLLAWIREHRRSLK